MWKPEVTGSQALLRQHLARCSPGSGFTCVEGGLLSKQRGFILLCFRPIPCLCVVHVALHPLLPANAAACFSSR